MIIGLGVSLTGRAIASSPRFAKPHLRAFRSIPNPNTAFPLKNFLPKNFEKQGGGCKLVSHLLT